jgi:hypothetical protein
LKKIRNRCGAGSTCPFVTHARSLALLPIALIAFLTTACGSTMGRAMTAFEDGRYPEAVGELRALESEARTWPEDRRAKYALYRGLTHLACGDARSADRWLSSAKRSWENNPELFDDAERGRLLAAWRSMGRMPGELPTR